MLLWGLPGCGQELDDILSRGSGGLGVELGASGLLGDVSTLWNLGRTLPCYTAALWLSEKWMSDLSHCQGPSVGGQCLIFPHPKKQPQARITVQNTHSDLSSLLFSLTSILCLYTEPLPFWKKTVLLIRDTYLGKSLQNKWAFVFASDSCHNVNKLLVWKVYFHSKDAP